MVPTLFYANVSIVPAFLCISICITSSCVDFGGFFCYATKLYTDALDTCLNYRRLRMVIENENVDSSVGNDCLFTQLLCLVKMVY